MKSRLGAPRAMRVYIREARDEGNASGAAAL
jgi:hypothetical protein